MKVYPPDKFEYYETLFLLAVEAIECEMPDPRTQLKPETELKLELFDQELKKALGVPADHYIPYPCEEAKQRIKLRC